MYSLYIDYLSHLFCSLPSIARTTVAHLTAEIKPHYQWLALAGPAPKTRTGLHLNIIHIKLESSPKKGYKLTYVKFPKSWHQSPFPNRNSWWENRIYNAGMTMSNHKSTPKPTLFIYPNSKKKLCGSTKSRPSLRTVPPTSPWEKYKFVTQEKRNKILHESKHQTRSFVSNKKPLVHPLSKPIKGTLQSQLKITILMWIVHG